MSNDKWVCKESVTGIHYPDAKGYCSWCKVKAESKLSKPPPEHILSELNASYGYFYDVENLVDE